MALSIRLLLLYFVLLSGHEFVSAVVVVPGSRTVAFSPGDCDISGECYPCEQPDLQTLEYFHVLPVAKTIFRSVGFRIPALKRSAKGALLAFAGQLSIVFSLEQL